MIGIIGAMEEEITEILRHLDSVTEQIIGTRKFYSGTYKNKALVVALAGIGKVNAAHTTSLLCENFDVECIINLGVAGGQNGAHHKDVIIANGVVYHDVDVTAFSHNQYGQIPGQPAVFMPDERLKNLALEAKDLIEWSVVEAKVASGDRFVYSKIPVQKINALYDDILAIEMEAGAIAHIASIYKIPFLIIRSISDVVEDLNQATDYESFLSDAVKNATRILAHVIENY